MSLFWPSWFTFNLSDCCVLMAQWAKKLPKIEAPCCPSDWSTVNYRCSFSIGWLPNDSLDVTLQKGSKMAEKRSNNIQNPWCKRKIFWFLPCFFVANFLLLGHPHWKPPPKTTKKNMPPPKARRPPTVRLGWAAPLGLSFQFQSHGIKKRFYRHGKKKFNWR